MTDDSQTKKSGISYSTESSMIPAKELARLARKRDYEKAKAARKEEKAVTKAKKLAEKADARAARDQALWNALKRGSDIEE
jgi:hypothetical protein